MKSDYLAKLHENGFPVPRFYCINKPEEIDLSFSDCELFAVRSSFSTEDGTDYSYAGQFKTILNVPRMEVKNAAVQVISSAKNGQNQYTAIHGLTGDGDMTVIIQEMVYSDYSGVLFTANPLGIMNEAVVVVGSGVGSGVVEDRVPTTTYYYNLHDKLYYYETQEDSPKLKDALLEQLISLGRQIAALFHGDMDIEFAVQDEQIYILQARPITTLPEGRDIILDNSNIVESYPGISLPVTQSFAKEIYASVFTGSLLLLTKEQQTVRQFQSVLDHMVESVNGRIYYRISNWYQILFLLPFHNHIIPVWQEMLGVASSSAENSDAIPVSRLTRVKTACSFFSLLITTPRKMDQLNIYFKTHLPDYTNKVKQASSCQNLMSLYRELTEELGSKWCITLANDLYAFLFTALAKRRYPLQIKDIKQLESLKPVKALERLVALAAAQGQKSAAYRIAKEQYIDLYGDRCLEELKLETDTFRVSPQLLENYIKTAAFEKNPVLSTLSRENTGTEKKRWEPWVVKKAKLGIRNREISRMNRSRIFGLAREILLKTGLHFMNQQIIDKKEDIFWLYLDEIQSCAVKPVKMQELIESRKETYDRYQKLPSYSKLIFRGKIFDKSPLNINNQIFDSHSESLQGIPCSSGVVRGTVLVVDRPDLTMDASDKILVTEMTDPGWVFLIHHAKGIIAEKGSLLSHTAIVTRELKKPSVVAVSKATRFLKNGDFIELNGDTGSITVLERIPEP